MKKLILAFLVLITISCKAQNVTLKEVKSNELNQFVGSLGEEYKRFLLKGNVVRTIITFNSVENSTGTGYSGEVTNNIYISNCEYGELLVCKLYVVENLIKIKVENVTENGSNVIVEISSGNLNERKIDKILIPLLD
jgi:hypothetical protein